MEIDESVKITLTKSDVESAIRDFVCHCHPEYAVGYTIEVDNDDLRTVHCTAEKGVDSPRAE